MKLKKIIVFAIAVLFCFAALACGGTKESGVDRTDGGDTGTDRQEDDGETLLENGATYTAEIMLEGMAEEVTYTVYNNGVLYIAYDAESFKLTETENGITISSAAAPSIKLEIYDSGVDHTEYREPDNMISLMQNAGLNTEEAETRQLGSEPYSAFYVFGRSGSSCEQRYAVVNGLSGHYWYAVISCPMEALEGAGGRFVYMLDTLTFIM